jgi:hypothetical protein
MKSAASLVLLLALCLPACSMTVNAVNPRPNVVVGPHAGTLSLDVASVSDDYEVGRVSIHQFRKSLTTAFRNAVGDNLAASGDKGSVRLVISSVELELANLGQLGQFVTMRYRAKWTSPDGKVLAQVAGVARPRNPTETGPRHLEDAIEVMFENVIEGLDKATQHAGTANSVGAL